jgi:hypothetical protein
MAAKGGEHFGPDVFVSGFVFREAIGFDAKKEADALHGGDGSDQREAFNSGTRRTAIPNQIVSLRVLRAFAVNLKCRLPRRREEREEEKAVGIRRSIEAADVQVKQRAL